LNAPRHLVLVGLMGVGKSTVGRICAERLHRAFVDTDELVVEISGRSVAELFAQGESEFRRWERQAVEQTAASDEPLVVSCGGGVVLDPRNRSALRATGMVVWLRAAPETLLARVGDGSGRPLLAGDPGSALRRLASEREPAYRAAAHEIVDTDARTLEDVTNSVLAAARIESTADAGVGADIDTEE
jgi:shikimate kinase